MNPFASLGASDFLDALQKLLPRGAAWPRDPASVQTGYVAALADGFAALQARTSTLSEVESDPEQTLELLPDWEADWGLPDPCTGEGASIQDRRAQLLARITATGGQSPAYFVQFAATLGYAITITEFMPFRAGMSFGQPLYGVPWQFTWQVNVPTFTIDDFRLGESAFGEQFATWGSTALQCELQRLKPAHTELTFNYS